MVTIFALAFLYWLETWSWKRSFQSIVILRSFCEFVLFSMSKLLTDALVLILRLERPWYFFGFALTTSFKNHLNLFMVIDSSFSKI